MKKINSAYVKRKIYKAMPTAIRKKINRYLMPSFRLSIEDFQFRSASTPQEYLAAFNLVYKVFVKAGYAQPSHTPFRLAPQHCHPDSRVFIGKTKIADDEKVVYSISIFPDSEDGLPMDMVFKSELDRLRSEGRVLVEAGHLAADPAIKAHNMNIPMLGNKMLHYYAHIQQEADNIVIAVHPKHVWFYEDMLLFKKIGRIDAYSYANNNPAVALSLDLRTMKSKYKDYYKSYPIDKSLYHFFFETISESIVLPQKKERVDEDLLKNIECFYGIKS